MCTLFDSQKSWSSKSYFVVEKIERRVDVILIIESLYFLVLIILSFQVHLGGEKTCWRGIGATRSSPLGERCIFACNECKATSARPPQILTPSICRCTHACALPSGRVSLLATDPRFERLLGY